MRRALMLCLVLLAGLAAPAAAQDEMARELQRKAKAKERDEGFCQRAAERLERFGQQHVRARLNEMLGRADGETVTMMFLSEEAVPTQTCIYLVFHPAAMKGGLKCRRTEVYGCPIGRDCRSKTDDVICEKKPGIWD
jgi:uncharacterized protein (DUF3084 family)